jgi:hypothetical protein
MQRVTPVEQGEHVVSSVPIYGGPEDGGMDEGLISDGELCGKIFFSQSYDNYCHCYSLIYNHDDGYKFVYEGLKAYHQNESGDFVVEEDEDGE